MKRIMSILLIMATLVAPAFCEVTQTAQVVSPAVVSEINKPIEQPIKITTGGWIWIGVFVIVASVFGSMAYSTKQPI